MYGDDKIETYYRWRCPKCGTVLESKRRSVITEEVAEHCLMHNHEAEHRKIRDEILHQRARDVHRPERRLRL